MANSLQNLQFYKSFRMKTRDKDKVNIQVTPLEGDLRGQVFEQDISIIDINLSSMTFVAPNFFKNGDMISLNIFTKSFFNKWNIVVQGKIVRSFINDCGKGLINYGISLNFQNDESELKYFLTDFIHSFSTSRLKSYLIESALRESETKAIDGVEFYSLLTNLFFDTSNSSIADCLDHTTTFLRAEKCKLYVINVDTDKLEVSYNTISEENEAKDFREGIPGDVFTTGQLVNIDYTNQVGHSDKINQILATPLYNDNRQLIGVLEFTNKLEGRFTFRDEKSIQLISKLLTQFFEGFNPSSKSTQVAALNPTLKENYIFLGQSSSAVRIRRTLDKLKNSNKNLHIVGEQGLGKSFMASSLHQYGSNSKNEFISIDCANESNFNTFISNSFEDAHLDKPGTVYLKNCGSISLEDQQVMYQYLSHSKKRIISSSLYDLDSLVKKGVYVNDFYKLLTTTYIHLKPLRNRKDEILDLARYFLEVECEKRSLEKKYFSSESVQKMLSYLWPGNTDELEKVIKKALMKQNEDALVDLEIHLNKAPKAIGQNTEMFSIIGKLVNASDISIGLDEHEKILKEIYDRGKKAS